LPYKSKHFSRALGIAIRTYGLIIDPVSSSKTWRALVQLDR